MSPGIGVSGSSKESSFGRALINPVCMDVQEILELHELDRFRLSPPDTLRQLGLQLGQ